MGREHQYPVTVRWTGNTGSGTSAYRAYSRDHEVSTADTGTLPASSDPAFRGERSRWNPEQLYVSAISECHMLWYLHLATEAGVVVESYEDAAVGVMQEDDDGRGGEFAEVVLRPRVQIRAGDAATAEALHDAVHRHCFIARSVATPIRHEPTTRVLDGV